MSSLLSLLPNLSLPLLLPFLSSPLTTLSTSLNLLLLNLTYTSLTISYSPLRIELFLTLAARVLFFLLPALIATGILNAVPGWSVDERFAERVKNKRGRKMKWKEVGLLAWIIFANTIHPLLLQAAIEYLLTQILFFPSALRLPRTLPLPGSVLWDIFWVYLLRSVIVYTVHRYILHDVRGGRQADWHWEYVHERWGSRVTPLLPLLEHPMNFLLVNWLPVYLPCALLRTHLLTYTLILTLTSLESILSHSYLSPPALLLQILPLYAWSPYHLFAVKQRTERHFGEDEEAAFESWGVMDWCCGTSGQGRGVEGAKGRIEGARKEMEKRGRDWKGRRGSEGSHGSKKGRGKGRKSRRE